MFDLELSLEIIAQVLEATQRIERRMVKITCVEDFLSGDVGIDKLDGICMMLVAIGESLKNLDKVTSGELLRKYPEVDWRGAKGMRDIISHHYFDLNADVVFDVCKNKLPGLMKTVRRIQDDLITSTDLK